nr:hypothetical protein [Pseudomonas chlororaphis]
MQRLLISLLICLGFVLPATAQAWWQDDWHYRKQISIDTTPTARPACWPSPKCWKASPAST